MVGGFRGTLKLIGKWARSSNRQKGGERWPALFRQKTSEVSSFSERGANDFAGGFFCERYEDYCL